MKSATARSYRDLTEEQERRAQKLQQSSLVIDAVGSSIVSPEPPMKDGKGHVERALEAGVNVLNVTLAGHADTFERFLDQVADYLDLFDARENTMQVETIADITEAKESGKLGIIFGVQTGSIVGPTCTYGRSRTSSDVASRSSRTTSATSSATAAWNPRIAGSRPTASSPSRR